MGVVKASNPPSPVRSQPGHGLGKYRAGAEVLEHAAIVTFFSARRRQRICGTSL